SHSSVVTYSSSSSVCLYPSVDHLDLHSFPTRRSSDLAAQSLKPYEGQEVYVLCEGSSKRDETVLAGYTEKNKLVNFKAPQDVIGKIVKVKITEAKQYSLNGEFVEVVSKEKVVH